MLNGFDRVDFRLVEKGHTMQREQDEKRQGERAQAVFGRKKRKCVGRRSGRTSSLSYEEAEGLEFLLPL